MTFSIIGFDPLKNRFGVAVSSCHIAVGSTVSFVRSRVGAVATQGQTNPYLGIRSLESLQSCSDSKIVLEDLIKEDFGRGKRQVHLIDKYGRSACWTGQECFQTSGHISGENFSVAGNFLENIEVLEVMADVFKQSDPNIKLGKRLLDALNAGENIGDYCSYESYSEASDSEISLGTNDCYMNCHYYWVGFGGDGYCNTDYNCAEFNYDGGDCSTNYSNNGSPNKAKKEDINKFNNRGLFKLLGKRIITNQP